MRTLLLAFCLAACVRVPRGPIHTPDPNNPGYTRPAERCHYQHPTYTTDVAQGRCERFEDVQGRANEQTVRILGWTLVGLATAALTLVIVNR